MSYRENFVSRIGFLMVVAGCAIGLGNVWRFPYITGESGGAIFVLFYLFFGLSLFSVNTTIYRSLIIVKYCSNNIQIRRISWIHQIYLQ